MRSKDFHLPVEAIVEKEVVGHAYPVGLHRVALAIVVVTNIGVIVVTDLLSAMRRKSHFGVSMSRIRISNFNKNTK